MYSEPSQTSGMELFEKTVNGSKPSVFLQKFYLCCLTRFWIRLLVSGPNLYDTCMPNECIVKVNKSSKQSGFCFLVNFEKPSANLFLRQSWLWPLNCLLQDKYKLDVLIVTRMSSMGLHKVGIGLVNLEKFFCW